MDNRFFEKPILNSPYAPPSRHWELDADGQPTQRIIDRRRPAKYVTPVPKPRKRKDVPEQGQLPLDVSGGISGPEQAYDPTPLINELHREVDLWRRIPDPLHWGVTPSTASLLRHWRHHRFSHIRPFFCQVEAVETLIYLTEALPRLVRNKAGAGGRKLPASMLDAFQDPLDRANADANPGLNRLALKLATGAGKTTVMAMIIAWQTINEVRAIKTGRAGREKFTHGFLVITPGITIRERLRVLMPNDPDSYYRTRELVPPDMLDDLSRAVIVITNYHAFKLRERIPLACGTRALLQGQGEALQTLETEGQMIHRVMPELQGMKRIMVLNDEAHHCYREKPGEESLKGEDREEAKRNNEAARLWISGIEAVQRKVAVSRVVDLLESGEVLDPDFRKMAATEIERFRREIVQRTGDRKKAESIGDQELLREVMNTVARRAGWAPASGAWCRFPCSPRDGMPIPSPMCWASAPSEPSFSANRSWAGPCGASPTISTPRACSTWNTPTCWASPSISRPSPWWCRRLRPRSR